MNALPLLMTVFLACAVEATEALTIVLAAGTARGWRSTWYGVVAALAALAVVTTALGPAVGRIPLAPLRLVVGTLLLLFGLQWVRKAVERAAGRRAPHDEAAIYARERGAAEQAVVARRGIVTDWYAFTLAGKGVLLEGLEVVFIVVTFGQNQHAMGVAVLGATLATLVVAGVGLAVRTPLSRLPENAVKFVVGIVLTGFGLFWATEGAGARWPGGEAALLVLLPCVALVALGATAVLRRVPPAAPAVGGPIESN